MALDNVSFTIEKGKIYGLLGGNGAGKTTLMNVLSGLYKADKGEILINGRMTKFSSPADAIKYKINMVHQHFTLVPVFTVEENIILGMKIKNEPLLSIEREEKKIQELMVEFGLKLELKTEVKNLSVGDKQKVELLRALYRNSELVILDEPTTFLVPSEVEVLFSSLRKIVDKRGVAVIFITHKIREALAVCDEIKVLREGREVGTLSKDEASIERLTEMMVGRSLDLEKSILFSRKGLRKKALAKKEPAITIRNLTVVEQGVPVVKNCSFDVFKGEIFGIAGIVGNGQKELVEALMRIRKADRGEIIIDVKEDSTCGMLEGGVAYIPEDRMDEGYLPTFTVANNLILGCHKIAPFSRRSFLDFKAIKENARELISEFKVKTPSEEEIASRLSGGNIQKLLVARVFSKQHKLVVAHNPTRGLDIPSTEFVYKKFLELKDEDAGILLISEDLDELILMSDRIGVMYKGELVDVLERERFDKYKIGLEMLTGQREKDAGA